MNADLTRSFVFSPQDDAPDSWALTDPEDFARRLAEAFPEPGTLSGVPMRRTTARAEEAASGAGGRCPLMSAEELADFLGVPMNTVYIWNHRHQGPRAHKVGRYLRYRWSEVEAWLEAQAVDRAT